MHHFTVPPTMYKCSKFYISLQALVIFCFVLFDNSNLNRYELPHDLICFPLMIISDSNIHALIMLSHCLLLNLLKHLHESPKWTSPNIMLCTLSQEVSRLWREIRHPPQNGQIGPTSHYLK